MSHANVPSALLVVLFVGPSGCGPQPVADTTAVGTSSTSVDATDGAPIGSGDEPADGGDAPRPGTPGVPPSTSGATTIMSGSGPGSTTESMDSDSEGGSTFLVLPDLGGGCSSGLLQCDVWAQDCPRGEKCVPVDGNGNGVLDASRCVEIAREPAAVGDPCVVNDTAPCGHDDNCDFGALCYFVDPESGEGTCVEQCTGNQENPSCAAPTQCLIGRAGTYALCLETCHPLMADCGDGQGCFRASLDAFWCLPDDMATVGYLEGCTQINQCAGNMACLGAEGAGCDDAAMCCTPYCDFALGNPNPDCPDADAGQACVLRFRPGEAPEGFEDLGYCQAPR